MAVNYGLLEPVNIAGNMMAGQQQAQQNQLAQQQAEMRQQEFGMRKQEFDAQAEERQLKLADYKTKQAGLDKFLELSVANGKTGSPKEMAGSFYEYALTQRDPQLIMAAQTMMQAADEREKYDAISKSQQPIPAQQAPAPMAGGLGTGTYGLDNIPGMPNALASRAAAPMNALAAQTADPVAALESRIAELRTINDPRAQAEATRLQKQVDEYNRVHSVGGSLMTGTGRVIGTAPKEAAKTIGTVNPGDFTSASVAKFNVSGNYADLVAKPIDRVAKDDPKTTVAFREVDNAGNVTFYNKFGESISTQKGAGKPSATFEKITAQRSQLAKDLTAAITELTNITKDGGLIDQSTGSGAGRLIDLAAGFGGKAMPGAIAAAKLAPIADLALKMIPRFEGPQSNADTISYKQAAGQLADSSLPNEIRKEAGKTVLRLMQSRKDQFVTQSMLDEGTAAPAASSGEWKVVK